MSSRFKHPALLTLILMPILFSPSLATLEAGFSQGCYSACPRKIMTLQTNNSRQEVDKQWIQCLKECHQADTQKFFIGILCAILFILIGIYILIEICWGEKIMLKYTFHVERKKRLPIKSEQQRDQQIFQQALTKFKQFVADQLDDILIEFQNDQEHRKTYLVQDAIFHQRKPNELQNMFSVIICSKKQVQVRKTQTNQKIQTQQINQKKPGQEKSQLEIHNNSELQIKAETFVQEEEYSQLMGAITLTSKGINLWWIKIDQKPKEELGKCKWCLRRKKNYLTVYEKDPFAPEDSFIGNVVLEDSSKRPQERYGKYAMRRQERPGPMRMQEEVVIQT